MSSKKELNIASSMNEAWWSQHHLTFDTGFYVVNHTPILRNKLQEFNEELRRNYQAKLEEYGDLLDEYQLQHDNRINLLLSQKESKDKRNLPQKSTSYSRNTVASVTAEFTQKSATCCVLLNLALKQNDHESMKRYIKDTLKVLQGKNIFPEVESDTETRSETSTLPTNNRPKRRLLEDDTEDIENVFSSKRRFEWH